MRTNTHGDCQIMLWLTIAAALHTGCDGVWLARPLFVAHCAADDRVAPPLGAVVQGKRAADGTAKPSSDRPPADAGRAKVDPTAADFDPTIFLRQMFDPEASGEKEALAGIEVSLEEERRAGTAGADALIDEFKRKNIAVVSRGKDVQYVRQLVDVLRTQMKNKDRYRRITVYVANTAETDARSFPGGTLIFFRGLLNAVGSEAALAVIVGHELSHLDRGHQLAPIKRLKLAEQTFTSAQGFDPQQFFKAGTTLAAGFARPFRPEDEAEADRDGATWAYHAGYDPRELAELLRAMAAKQQPGNRPPPLPFFRTHPPHEERARAILALYDELEKADPREKLYIGRENLRLRTPRRVKEFAE